MGPGEALDWKGHAQPSTVGRAAPWPTAPLGEEPEAAQAVPAEELPHADPKEGPGHKALLAANGTPWLPVPRADSSPLTRTPHSRR